MRDRKSHRQRTMRELWHAGRRLPAALANTHIHLRTTYRYSSSSSSRLMTIFCFLGRCDFDATTTSLAALLFADMGVRETAESVEDK